MQKEIFVGLGQILKEAAQDAGWQQAVAEAHIRNHWFTPENQWFAFQTWAEALQPDAVDAWLRDAATPSTAKKVGLMLAGNIPLVGLHDILCVIASGHHAVIKTSSDDAVLPKFLLEQWTARFPELQGRWEITEQLKGIDAAIATGSNNSARYFDYYFRNIPHIIRKNRHSIALVRPEEGQDVLQAIGEDVFRYYGLGCRNVTHLFLPEGYDIGKVFEAWEPWADIIHHHRYANNYTYHRAILLMNLSPHLDNGFVLMQESNELYSPAGLLRYSFYNDETEVQAKTVAAAAQLQCIVGKASWCNTLPGQSQRPGLSDYADGVNTLQFLASLAP
jgi:hypothetical protein